MGRVLHDRAISVLSELGARAAWFIEYAEDERFISFLRHRGFRR